MEMMLELSGLRKSYGGLVAIEGLDLSLRQGEALGLLGPNGAGKTTTIECCLGLKRFDAGRVEILGMDPVTQRREVFQRVGVQFQNAQFQDRITVAEICQLTHSLYQDPGDWRPLLVEFGLGGRGKQMVGSLSGGERQRLSILLALIPKPRLLILDELTTGLDTLARREIWGYLERLRGEGVSMLLVSHYMDEVQRLCDRVCIMKQGRVVALGSVEEILRTCQAVDLEMAYLSYTEEAGN